MKYIFLFASGLLFTCSSDRSESQKIIDNTIEVYGGDRFLKGTIEFDFRERHYVTRRNGGVFSHERIFKDTAGNVIHDYLTNDGFHREINDKHASIPDTMAVKYTRSVNSTIYFALLPYGLNDPAVRKKLLGKTTFNGQSYFIVEITFEQQGGGEDFNDIFLYWIHEQTFSLDYMAYLYFTDGGGLRFRRAFNRREVNGISFQDYVNYQPKGDSATIDQMERLYKEGSLEELSKIELRNIQVY